LDFQTALAIAAEVSLWALVMEVFSDLWYNRITGSRASYANLAQSVRYREIIARNPWYAFVSSA
jgi:hypothetical protein